MTIKIFLSSWSIQGQKDDLIERDLIQILQDNNGTIIKSHLISTNRGKWFKAELENRQNEEPIANNINNKQIKLYNYKIKLEIEYELIIKNIPHNSTKESLESELKQFVKSQDNDINVRIPTQKKYAFITVYTLEEAYKLINDLNNKILNGRNLKVEFSEIKLNQKSERTGSVSDETLDKKTLEVDLTPLGYFYEKRDYDLVTETLKKFIYEVCTYLSNLPSHQEITQIRKENNYSDLKQDE